MYDDILGKRNEGIPEVDKDSIIKAQADNIKQKQELIEDLLRKITDLERQLENENNVNACAGI